MTLQLHSVTKVVYTDEPNAFKLTCTITDLLGDTYECEYVSREHDEFGLNPIIRQWLVDNPDFPRDPYEPPAPPTEEELREQMPNLTARQFRLGLVAGGKSPSQVTAAIAQMPEGPDKETAEIEWEYATTFKRTHPLVVMLSGALGLTPEEIDTMWTNATEL